MKRRTPSCGCPRIAQQIALTFGVVIDKDVVRRILRVHYRPESDWAGPSWLTFPGHMKDSLWSCDLFRCESATLRTYWVLVVMDQFTRRIVGFGVQCGNVDGPALCRMFQQRDPAAAFTEVSEHGQRFPLSVSSVAGQPPGA
jgi:transposase InsO family protein